MITHVIINSIIWLPLRGAPGSRRVLKLGATMTLDRPPLPVRVRRPGKPFVRRGRRGSFRDEMPPEVLDAFMAEAGPTLRELGYTND